MIFSAVPLEVAQPLMAGFGPMYVASMAPEKSASMAAGPALKVFGSSLVLPRDCWNRPFLTPIRAGAWVMFGK